MTRRISLFCLPLFAVGLILLGLVTPAEAHPGHGSIDSSHPLHYLADPAHATPWMIVFTAAIMALVAFRWLRKRQAV